MIKEAAACFVDGLRDSVRVWTIPISSVWSRAFLKLVGHNFFFIVSYLLYSELIIPLCREQLAATEGFWGAIGAFLFATPNTTLLVLWLGPMYLYSAYANAVWHSVLVQAMAPPKEASSSSSSALNDVTTTIYRIILFNCMLGFSFLSGFTPLIGGPLQAMFIRGCTALIALNIAGRSRVGVCCK
jgi:hypothetical protein